jgi:hypothetical protein
MPERLLALIFTLLIGAGRATAAEFAGTEIPDTIRLPGSDHELQLNGGGIREKLFVDIYIGALYLPERSGDVAAILADTGPASVRMQFLYKEVSRDKIVDGWNDGLRANLLPADFSALQPRLEQFNELFRTVQRGDVIRIDHVPGTGTEVRINDEWRGSIAGNDFYRALLRIWLGDRPVSKSLKQGMLGNG